MIMGKRVFCVGVWGGYWDYELYRCIEENMWDDVVSVGGRVMIVGFVGVVS